MAGVGFVLFIFPPLAGVAAGLLLLLVNRLRFLAGYAFCCPLCGTVGGWYGLDVGIQLAKNSVLDSWLSTHGVISGLVGGYSLGIGVGALVALGINRLAGTHW